MRVVPEGGLGRGSVTWEGEKLYVVSLVDNFQNPTVHSDIVPVLGEVCEMPPKDDRGPGGSTQVLTNMSKWLPVHG